MSTLIDTDAVCSCDSGIVPTQTMDVPERGPSRAISSSFAQADLKTSVIQEERDWRQPAILASRDRVKSRLFAARWTGNDLSEKTSEIAGDYHMLRISLNRTGFHFWFGAKSVANKDVMSGTTVR